MAASLTGCAVGIYCHGQGKKNWGQNSSSWVLDLIQDLDGLWGPFKSILQRLVRKYQISSKGCSTQHTHNSPGVERPQPLHSWTIIRTLLEEKLGWLWKLEKNQGLDFSLWCSASRRKILTKSSKKCWIGDNTRSLNSLYRWEHFVLICPCCCSCVASPNTWRIAVNINGYVAFSTSWAANPAADQERVLSMLPSGDWEVDQG